MELAERKELWNTTKSPTENIKIDSGTKQVHGYALSTCLCPTDQSVVCRAVILLQRFMFL